MVSTLTNCVKRNTPNTSFTKVEVHIKADENIELKTGDIIEFGSYRWLVLEVLDNHALIITENLHMLCLGQFFNSAGTAKWETSFVRQYLNDEFFNSLRPADRAQIRETYLINEDNPWYFTKGGSDTTDRIFLLSISEVVRYFGDSGQVQKRPDLTVYYISDEFNSARMVKFDDGRPGWQWLESPGGITSYNSGAGGRSGWQWLRTPGGESMVTAGIDALGTLHIYGMGVSNTTGGVRPALWLNFKAAEPHAWHISGNWEGPPFPPPLYLNLIPELDPIKTEERPDHIILEGRRFGTEMTQFDVYGSWFTSEELAQLRYMTNLTELVLSHNKFNDLTPLAGLTNLTTLTLGRNEISDLTPLAGLTNLTHLTLHDNQISDLTPLADLANLKELVLWNNQISDLTPLAGLTNLTTLELGYNKISNLTPLSNLTNLEELLLNDNQISDITALASLTNLTFLVLEGNPISDISVLSGLAKLKYWSLNP